MKPFTLRILRFAWLVLYPVLRGLLGIALGLLMLYCGHLIVRALFGAGYGPWFGGIGLAVTCIAFVIGLLWLIYLLVRALIEWIRSCWYDAGHPL